MRYTTSPRSAVGMVLDQLLAENGWIQADLANAAGVARQTINNIMGGRYQLSVGLALALERGCRRPGLARALLITQLDAWLGLAKRQRRNAR